MPVPPQPEMDVPDTQAGEQVNLREAGLDIALPEQLRALRDHIVEAFDDVGVLGFRGELTLEVAPERLVELLTFCRDDPDARCELLMDLSGVHWPGGRVEDTTQETTGWPTYAREREGRIEVDYLLYSVRHNHRFRVRASVPDEGPELPSATGVYRSAVMMEREAFDFFGVRFTGHPNLTRVHMPDGWEGHPQRKDYPLGGVEVKYAGGAFIPPPDERKY